MRLLDPALGCELGLAFFAHTGILRVPVLVVVAFAVCLVFELLASLAAEWFVWFHCEFWLKILDASILRN